MSHFADRFTVLIDACCLAGALRRNMLLSLAEEGFYRARWSSKIMEETSRAINSITEGKADPVKQINAMNIAFPEAMVDGFEELEQAIIIGNDKASGLRDADDAHVLAAAIKVGASVIVTDNLKDFPQRLLDQYELEAKNSDEFIADCIDLQSPRAMYSLNKMRLRFQHPEYTWDRLCQKVESQGLSKTASIMQKYTDLIQDNPND